MGWKRLYLFRHGETDWNREGRFQGHIDVPINATGRAQARALVPRLRPLGLEVVLSSDLLRAQETAGIVAAELGVRVLSDPRLREAHLGEAQGLTREEIGARFGEEVVKRWRSIDVSDADVSYRGGETGRQVMDRVFEALEAVFEAQPFATIGVCTHGGVIRRIMQRLLPQGSEPVPIPNGVLYQVRYHRTSRDWRVEEAATTIKYEEKR
ncbi:MAG: histidine phosphatase family protein [Oligoflexia bacterium]|nr:histidine phosphatase family protein [Oligoflexia bacterium]